MDKQFKKEWIRDKIDKIEDEKIIGFIFWFIKGCLTRTESNQAKKEE